MGKTVAIFDIEANGVHATKIHCLSYIASDGTSKSLTEKSQMVEFFTMYDYYCGHNIIRYDLPTLKRIYDIDVPLSKLIDTLVLSRWYFPYQGKYGLADWGEFFGVPKPEVEDWENQPIEVYIHRCQEDAKINYHLYKYICDKIAFLYENPEDIVRLFNYSSFKEYCVYLAESYKIKLDLELLDKNLEWMERLLSEKRAVLEQVMPKNPKYSKANKPKTLFKKDGSLSVSGQRWFERLKQAGLPEDHSESFKYVSKYEKANPSSISQIKSWLFSMGWKPATFKYVKQSDGSTKKIEQIRDGKDLCSSVLVLAEKHPVVKELDGYSVLQSRVGQLKGFLRDCDPEGFITATSSGITNTLRLTHKVLVNLPGVDPDKGFGDGTYIRGCLVAREGYELCGSDISSLEDSTKQHYMYEYDPEFVKEMQTPGFDPHLDIALKSGILTEDQVLDHKLYSKTDGAQGKSYNIERKQAKVVNFCLPTDTTTVLTPQGWKTHTELSVGDLIYSYNTDEDRLEVVPIEMIPTFEDVNVGHIGNNDWRFECTENHRWFVKRRVRTGGERKLFYQAKDLVTECNIITSAPLYNESKLDVTIQECGILGWILADGYLKWSDKDNVTSSSHGTKKSVRCTIGQKRFIEELEKSLDGVPYSKTSREDGLYYYNLKPEYTRSFWSKLGLGQTDKHETNYCELIHKMDFAQREEFLRTFHLADGGTKGSIKIIYQNRGNILDAVELALTLNGYSYNTSSNGVYKIKENVNISLKNRRHVTCQKFTKDFNERSTQVFCVNNKNGTFIAKQGDTVTITGNSSIYGVGAKKLALSLGISVKKAEQLLEGYWKRNWAVKQVAASQKIKQIGDELWLYNPVSRFYYSLRYQKDIFSTLNQSTGVFVFDTWLSNVIRRRRQLSAQFHDEGLWEIKLGQREMMSKLLNDAIDDTNRQLNLNVTIGIDTQFGNSYADVH